MSLRLQISPLASQDFDEIYTYISQNNPDAALRFFDAARKTFAKIATTPSLGRIYPTQNQSLIGLRQWGVKGFKKYIIFYLTREDVLIIIRIIHGSRDFSTLL
ncbi:type II toxin-antitoxin system RelE/ParE family toxin [Chamaesiphon minutus]|uniref:Plasmid stabilization system protein n=1 Tax=Chamaesiphon minutus (strain ATCC 27169 / PCC 6605) TaxID=1173020 RepID=K9UGR9_CHAP6|nr:type II toxin-antitoxin system RelE/ParE family toxin [Chamaesiphon minutus]AFY93636.1 plasmid stabilization system protein [Chamaesiphon minutus PCC 6605]